MMEQPREQVPRGWCRDDAGTLRRETVPSMLRRLAGWDYRQRAIYQITMTLADRASQALGCLEVMDVEGAWRPLVQVQVSRRDFGYRRLPKLGGGTKIARDGQGVPLVAVATDVFAQKKEAYLAAAQHGAVLISPCISEGEREVARLALAAGLPLVTLHNRGFARLEKPPGRYFEACAAGRLLMLAPAAWPYQPGAKVMTRADATALNRLCQWLVGADAAEINYQGMSPGNVDALARAAACGEAS